jgi:sodium/proline symporter
MTFAIAFAVYTLLIVAVGVYSARYARRSDEDYFLAGRSLGSWVAALSASASSESGWVTLGLVGWAFREGVTAYWILPGCVLGFLFNWFFIAGRMRQHSERVGALTLPDFFSASFRERVPILRILSVIVILIAMWLYVAAQFNAAGKSFAAAFDGLPYSAGVLIGAAIVLFYTVIGGFRAACWTDFVQGLVMVGTLIAFPVYLLSSTGGVAYLQTELAKVGGDYALSFWPQKTGAALIGFLLGSGALGINLGYPGQPHVLVRFMALKDRRKAILGGIISATWATLIYLGAVTVGLVVRAMTEGGAEWAGVYTAQLAAEAPVRGIGDTGLVLAARHLSGMVLAAVLAAICSTADSQLVVAASSCANDIYSRLVDRSGRIGHMLINRTVVFVLGIGAAMLVIDAKVEVFKFVLDFGWAVLGASFAPQVILLLMWKRASYAGCIAGMLVGFAIALIWPHVWDPAAHGGVAVYNLTLGFVVALVVNVLVSLAFPSRRVDAGEA